MNRKLCFASAVILASLFVNHAVLADSIETVESDTESNTPPVIVNTPIPDNPPTSPDTDKGNPGNDKDKGKAGEKCSKGMCERGDHGDRGKGN